MSSIALAKGEAIAGEAIESPLFPPVTHGIASPGKRFAMTALSTFKLSNFQTLKLSNSSFHHLHKATTPRTIIEAAMPVTKAHFSLGCFSFGFNESLPTGKLDRGLLSRGGQRSRPVTSKISPSTATRAFRFSLPLKSIRSPVDSPSSRPSSIRAVIPL